jgi:hypothetical protein
VDLKDLSAIDVARLDLAAAGDASPRAPGTFAPIAAWACATADGKRIVLNDFATCGAHGTDYTAWLPATNAKPAAFSLLRPARGDRVAAGPVLFEWMGFRQAGKTYALTVARDASLADVVARVDGIRTTRAVVREGLAAGATYWWKVTVRSGEAAGENEEGPSSFTVDASLPNTVDTEVAVERVGPRGLLAASPLDGDGAPSFGVQGAESGIAPAADRFGRQGGAVAFSGEKCAIVYRLASFPERDYTFAAWVCPRGLPTDRAEQVFSAWCAGMDDPLRVVFQGAKVWARIEAGQGYGTEGAAAENGVWIHVAAVKRGPRLELYVNGELRGGADVPEYIFSQARDFAIGANPHYGGNECLVGCVDAFAFHGEALSAAEIATLYREGR